jgi:hypothetical protein
VPEPQPLEYARPREPDPARARHPPAVTWLLLICVIAFFATGVMGLIYIDVLGLAAGGMMCASAVFILITVLGFLSRPQPAFVAGAILTFGAMGGAMFALLLNHATVQRIEQQIRTTRTPRAGGIIFIDAHSDLGADLVATEAARGICAVAAGLAFCLLVYLVVQSFQRRPGGSGV